MGDGKLDIAAVIRERETFKKYNKLLYYQPYKFQKAFHHAKRGQVYVPGDYDLREGIIATDRAIISANQIGKSLSAAMEVAMHATGEYPDWWEGFRFNKPVNILVAGKTNDTTRDVCQKELLGNPKIEGDFGSGTIPLDRIIGKPIRKAGVPMAYQAISVRHKSGGTSTIQLMAYEQGPPAFMGRNDYQVAWEDEEPPEDVQSQIHRCFFASKKYTMLLTFTPEDGYTNVVESFLNDLQEDQAVVRATWEDAPHMTEEAKASFLAKLPPYERDMRSKGIPMMGSGLVFPIKEDDFVIDPVQIPPYWRRICGVDFGIDHPFAAAWLAMDPDSDTIHLYSDYRVTGQTPPVHASAIRNKGDWIPIAWPHDGLARDKGSGVPLADIYRKQEKLNFLKEKFSNPPGPGQVEGQGGNGVEVGLLEMWQRMETGRFKVHSTCQSFLDEFRQYHRKDGKIVAVKDDVISAARYAVQSLRFAHTQPMRVVRKAGYRGASNW